MPKKLPEICYRILEVIKLHPQGISEGDMRTQLGIPSDQMVQFGRRRRDLNYVYVIGKRREGDKTLYYYVGERDEARDTQGISIKLRAEVLHHAKGRCAMCGRTIAEDGIKPVPDHKIPREWGGLTELENLWALCEECNAGKKNYFQSVDSDLMRQVMKYKSPRVRIGETLKAYKGDPVPDHLLAFVADREDWQKRTRDLRYLGWKITVTKKRVGKKVKSFYSLLEWKPWPDDPDAEISRYERERAARNRRE